MKDKLSEAILEKVEELDAADNHEEAINVLAKATQEGNLFAKTRLGKRLVVGDRAPYLPKEGAEFILESANQGHAEAVSTIASFQCTGIYQTKNWNQALSTLAYAAALGWKPAQEQLIILAQLGEPAISPSLFENPSQSSDIDYWSSLLSKIDLSKWLVAPSGIVLNEEPLVKSIPDLLPASVCRLLIRQSQQRLKPALVYDANNQRNYQSKTRTNSIAEFNLIENDFIHFLIQERMASACSIPMTQMEGTAILNYQPGQEIAEHFDFVSPDLPDYDKEIAANGQRIITFLIYLNDDYSAGETCFPKLGINHKGHIGEGLFFSNALSDGQPDLRSLHAGTPTTSGEKWIVSQFIRNRTVSYIL